MKKALFFVLVLVIPSVCLPSMGFWEYFLIDGILRRQVPREENPNFGKAAAGYTAAFAGFMATLVMLNRYALSKKAVEQSEEIFKKNTADHIEMKNLQKALARHFRNKIGLSLAAAGTVATYAAGLYYSKTRGRITGTLFPAYLLAIIAQAIVKAAR